MWLRIHWGGMSVSRGRGNGHEIVVKRCRALSRCCVGNCLAVRPGRSQPTTDSTPSLPSITVERVARPPHKPTQVANLTRPVSFSVLISTALPDSIQGKLATLEKASSSCNGGCETSFKSGNAPWVGCSQTGPEFTNLSATCTDTLTYKDYADCHDTKSFLGWDKNKIWWHCTSLLAGGKFQVAELKRSRLSR